MHPMTRANLEAALACEAMAAMRFRLFADRAADDGLEEIRALFESIGCDERLDQARAIADALGLVQATAENLASALRGELTEHDRLYPLFADQARRVGDLEAAKLFAALARDAPVHADAVRAAIARLGVGATPG